MAVPYTGKTMLVFDPDIVSPHAEQFELEPPSMVLVSALTIVVFCQGSLIVLFHTVANDEVCEPFTM